MNETNQPPTDFEEIVAELPTILGYAPTRTLIVAAVHKDGERGGAREIPLDMGPADAEALAAELNAHTKALVFVSVGLAPVDLKQAILPLLSCNLGVPISGMLAVDSFTAGAVFTDVATGEKGRVLDWRSTEAALEAAMSGHVIFGSEAEIDALYEPQRPVVLRAEGIQPLLEWIDELEQAIRGDVEVDAAKVGWMLTRNPITRNLALRTIDVNPSAAHDVFAGVGRVTRGRVRVEALTAAAVAAYVGGRTLLVTEALKAALKTADLIEPDWVPTFTWQVHDAYASGVEPHEVKRVLFGEAA